MSAPSDAHERRLILRFDRLTSRDAQLVAAQPDPVTTAGLDDPGIVLTDVMDTVMNGYADRPALGQRAVEFVTDAAGRTIGAGLRAPLRHPRPTARTWARVRALADALAGDPVQPGDRVAATLGTGGGLRPSWTWPCRLVGAVAVPLQTNAPMDQLRPILLETEPVAILSSVDHLDDTVELAMTAHPPNVWWCSITTRRSMTTVRRSSPPPRA